MSTPDETRGSWWRRSWSAVPELLWRTPAAVRLLIGLLLTLLGALIVFRPLTSLLLLGVYIGLSAIAAGILRLVAPSSLPRVWRRLFAGLWVLGGLVALVWLGRSLELVPVAISVLLIVGGLASLGDAVAGGRVTQRILAVAWGGAQVAFGVLALSWPDVTVLVVAVVFGARTGLFGASLAVRSGVELARERSDRPAAPPTPRRSVVIARDIGRIALSVVLVTASVAGWTLDDWLRDGSPVVDAFYDPPGPIPAPHGTLIRTDDYQGRAPEGGTVQRILYSTTGAVGTRVAGSALLILPTEQYFGYRPVVLWNHGTVGIARACAPSLGDASATKWAVPAIEEALARGWAVVAPDYSGQGTEGIFPYLIGEGEARSGLDAVLAAQQVEGVRLSSRIAVWGHSQGGHAALWDATEAEDYAPELDIVGVAALSPVTEPLALAREIGRVSATAELSILTSWVLVPYADTYPDVRLEDYVSPGALRLVREMSQRCPTEPGVIVSVAAALGVSEDRPLYGEDLTRGGLGRRLAQNAVATEYDVPLLVAWGSGDEVIPPKLYQRFVEEACERGTPVRWAVYQGVDHAGVMLPGSRFLPFLVSWTAARFAADGDYPVDDCARLG